MRRLFILLTIISRSLSGQDTDTLFHSFRVAETELEILQDRAFRNRDEQERFAANREMIAVFDRVVTNPVILNYTFSRLKDISILESRNRQLKLITWNVHKNDGTHAYFGYLLVKHSKRIKKGLFKHETIESYDHYKLIDRSAGVTSPETFIGKPDKWFGMLYTQLIECDGYYTLIGWDGNDRITQRKFVDVLYFNGAGAPVFGKDVFKFPRKNPRRLMFEYSTEVSMSLRYHPRENRIVYSQLGPNKQGNLLEGQYQYYGPNGEFNALEQKKSKWVTVENIEINSDIREFPASKKPNPKKEKPVYRPR